MGVTHAGTCGITANYCSALTANLTAGTNYYLVTTTFNNGTPISGVVWYYVDGVGLVAVDGGSVTPPAPSTSVYASSSAIGNSPALGAARIIDANSQLLNLFTGLSGNNAVSNAATQTLPLLTGGSIASIRSTMNTVNNIVQNRLDYVNGRASGDNFLGDKNVWMKPFASHANQNDRDDVAGYKVDTYGVAAGVDGSLSRALRVGGAFSYSSSNVSGQSTVAPQSDGIKNYQLIGYGSYSIDDRTDINFQIDAGQSTNNGNRQIAFTSSTASSSYKSDTAHAGINIGRAYALSSNATFIPSVRADYTWIRDQSYSETGAGLLNLNVSGRSAEAFVVGIDNKLTYNLNEHTALIANLGVGYDTINSRDAISAAFAGAPSATFMTYGINPSPWISRASVGAVYKLRNGFEITGRYDVEYRQSYLNQTASVNMRWAF